MKSDRLTNALPTALRVASLIALLLALPAQAQYKVVGPDGKVTYTDRPPPAQQGKVSPVATRGAAGAPSADANLPAELRQIASRYPVTLYGVSSACDLCTSARQFLRQRGIPFTEKQVMSADDTSELERVTGGRDVPVLTIGSQTMRGFSSDSWAAYLDAAGYPRESKLPPSYQYAAPVPIVDRTAATASRPAAENTAAPATPSAPPPAADNPTGIKF